MRNISFDNPYWLFLAIPLLLAVFIPFFISQNKDNRNKGWIASLVIHCLVIASVTLAAAGFTYTAIVTRTKVYVVADLSHSTSGSIDEIDKYISEIKDAMPTNSKLGVICFGKDAVIHTSSGANITSVRDAKVDKSETNIAGALDFAWRQFGQGEIKRVILMTDGCDTSEEGSVISAIERLKANNVKIDTVYVDSSLKDGEGEVQLSDAEYTGATYLNFDTTLKLLIDSNGENDVIVDLYRKGEGDADYEKIDTSVLRTEQGVNIMSFTLPTDTFGTFDYKAVLNATGDSDTENNVYTFTQSVAGERKVLLVTEAAEDFMAVNRLWGESAEIDVRVIGSNREVPYTVEDLSVYDEIVLSNVDIRKINNVGAFVDSLDTVVSRFGKSLITMGDLSMQNNDDEIFKRLEELLPVSYGNANKDEKLYTIILDVSRSMFDNYQLDVAKDAATKLISVLDDSDSVIFLPFAGSVLAKEGWRPLKLGDLVDFEDTDEKITYRQWIYREISAITPHNGTLLAAALEEAYKNIKELSFGESQVMIISDGESFSHESENAVELAETMHIAHSITVSTIGVQIRSENLSSNLLPAIAEAGGGEFHNVNDSADVTELVFADIADELNEDIIEKQTNVNIERYNDGVMDGILSIPDIYGFVNAKAKLDADTVLSVDYFKTDDISVRVPLYAYREHGNGRISSFTSSFTGDWLIGWDDSLCERFFGNVLSQNTPRERIDYPFDINLTYGGAVSTIEILPSYLNPRAKAELTLTAPDGTTETVSLAFVRNGYTATFDTASVGKYAISIKYSYGTHEFTANTFFNVSYPEEYDAFAPRDIGTIYSFM